MSKTYTTLKCGCDVSCDGGGRVIPCNSLDCYSDEYFELHVSCWICGECLVCCDHDGCIDTTEFLLMDIEDLLEETKNILERVKKHLTND